MKAEGSEGGAGSVDVDVEETSASPLSIRHINAENADARLREAVRWLERGGANNVLETASDAAATPLGVHPAPQARGGCNSKGKEVVSKDFPCVTFHDGGRLIKASVPTPPRESKGGGKRGVIREWSKASRVNLMRTLATLQQDALPLFITNTYPELECPTPSEFKKHFRRFTSAFDYAWKAQGGAFVWKVEFTKKRVPHLHLLVFGVGYSEFRAWFIKTWPHCIRSSHPDAPMVAGRGVEVPRSARKVHFYLGKYVWGEKGYQTVAGDEWGRVRWWGIWGRDRIPWAFGNEEEVPASLAFTYMRFIRRKGSNINSRRYRVARGWVHRPWWQCKARRRIRGRRYPSLSYIGDPAQWRRVMEHEQRPPMADDARPFRHPWP